MLPPIRVEIVSGEGARVQTGQALVTSSSHDSATTAPAHAGSMWIRAPVRERRRASPDGGVRLGHFRALGCPDPAFLGPSSFDGCDYDGSFGDHTVQAAHH
jgi:hypothetical protein